MISINLVGQFALVCGASKGIGLACAKELASNGANVILLSRDQQKLEEALESLPRNTHQRHGMIVADMSDLSAFENAVESYLSEFKSIDIIVNNSGGPAAGLLSEDSTENLQLAFDAHIKAAQIILKHNLSKMKEMKSGRIINIISTSVKSPIPGLGVSNTIRGAMNSWAKTLSVELAPYSITVNNILPGLTETDRLQGIIDLKAKEKGVSFEEMEKEMKEGIPAKRFGKPEEIAKLCTYLASSHASYINGNNICVDGGNTVAF